MTPRQRQASGIAGAAGIVVNGLNAGLDRSSHFSWEDWFHHASAQQRADALGLAQQQGVVYPHQLPPVTNGSRPPALTPESPLLPTLASLLAGKTDQLPAVDVHGVTFFDADLDEVQQQAVIRALHTPDLFLLDGLPGTGKSRVVTEIIQQAAARGWCVLLLAAQAASLDVVLERLIDRPDLFALRYLDPTEKSAPLPAWLQRFTPDAQRQSFLERVLTGARGNREQIETSCQQRRDEEPLWDALRSWIEQAKHLDHQLQVLRDQLAQIPAQVEAEVRATGADSAFAADWTERRQRGEQALRELANVRQTALATLAHCKQEADDRAARIAQLEPIWHAKKSMQVWTLTFWQNLLNNQVVGEMEDLQKEQAAATQRQQALADEIQGIENRLQLLREQNAADHAAALQAEIQRRQDRLSAELRAREDERQQHTATWSDLCRRLAHPPAEPTLAAIESAEQAWKKQRQIGEEQCQFAKQWTKFVEEAGPQLTGRLPTLANLLAGTLTTLESDASFREAAGQPFDLLICEDAESLTEADLLKGARQSRRCVLVGQTLAESPMTPSAIERPAKPFGALPSASTACWSRLWQTLGGDASAWPYSWFHEQGRLVCQLVPLAKEDRPFLCGEKLADEPEIELRILHRPKGTPRLAQVAFPPGWSFPQAAIFVARESEEIALPLVGRTNWWQEEPLRWTWLAGPSTVRVHAWLDLEPGVRMGTVPDANGVSGRLARIEFSKADGWDRTRAAAWLERHRPIRDHGRTAFLQTPYRFTGSLAQTVTSLVCSPHWLADLTDGAQAAPASFEYCAVPACPSQGWPKDGSGLELDLSAARCADRLPADLRVGLPTRGYVNFLEAQALVRRLESLVQSESSRLDAGCKWAVLALYPGQVELLRRLINRSEAIRACPFALEISLPSRMRQRECDIVFLSLTRSHSHRCVAFGDDVRELPWALTRARSRLFIFGDPGMLCKRTHWQGPLDHLDAQASHQELQRFTRLFAIAHPTSAQPHVNGLANGKGQ